MFRIASYNTNHIISTEWKCSLCMKYTDIQLHIKLYFEHLFLTLRKPLDIQNGRTKCAKAIKRKDGAQPAANEEMHLIVTDYCCHKFHCMPEPGLLVSTQTFKSLR